MSSIYQKRGVWYYQTTVLHEDRRIRVQKSLDTTDKTLGLELKKYWDEFYEEQNRNPFKKPRISLSKIIDTYLSKRLVEVQRNTRSQSTLDLDRVSLNHFFRFISKEYGDIYVDQVTRQMVQLFKDFRQEEDVVDTTISINLRHLKSFFSFLLEREYIEKNPVVGVRIPRTERREIIPSSRHWKKLYHFLKDKVDTNSHDDFECIFWIQMNTGMRIGEVMLMKWKKGLGDTGRKHSNNYVYLTENFQNITIYFKRRLRSIPVTKPIKKLLKKLYKERQDGVREVYVFENPNTKNPYLTSSSSHRFKKLMRKLRLKEEYTSHSLRHGFCSELLKRNGNIFTISQILGHSVVDITEIYSHLIPKDLEPTMTLVND